MKNLKQIITVIAMSIFLLGSFNVKAQTKKRGIHIHFHIEIGRPKHNCRGLWICKGSVDGDINLRPNSKNEKFENSLIEVKTDKSGKKKAIIYLKDLQDKKFTGYFDGSGEKDIEIKGIGTIIAKKYQMFKSKVRKENNTYLYYVVLDLK